MRRFRPSLRAWVFTPISSMTQPATILYIEDDDGSRRLVQRVLSHAGYTVIVAATALDGIDLAQQHRPDLILTDINLPDLTGREITVRLRSVPHLAEIPIVALTAQSEDSERLKTFVAGVTGYITKPINIDLLRNKVAEYLQGQQDTVDATTLQSAQRAYNQELVERLETSIRDLEASNKILRHLDQIKDDFIQLTAHELRTPLTTVYGYSRLVQSSTTIQNLAAQDPEVNASLTGLMDSIDRMHTVISEIITVSRFASGRIDLKTGSVQLDQILERVVNGYTQVIQQRNLQLFYIPSEGPAFQADEALLELAFNNIVGNAIKYTPDGGTITLNITQPNDEHVIISVHDTGIGVDPQEQPYIFDRFYTAGDTQLHSTSKTAFRGGGLGLGLAICQGIIESHGGSIWVESPGCDEKTLPGSTFFIELPINL